MSVISMSGNNITPIAPDDQFNSGALSDDEKANIRRFCGYPAYGAGASGFQGWRFFQAYGLLEHRLGSDNKNGIPNMAPAELSILRQYLQTLYTLEAAIPASGENLDTSNASVWTHNKNEVVDRIGLYNTWRRQMCGFIGIPMGPALFSNENSIRCIV